MSASVETKTKTIGILQFFKNPFDTMCELPQKYGDLYVHKLFKRKFYVVSCPHITRHILQKNYTNYRKDIGYRALEILLGKGLITNEGANWRKKRTMIQPAFHRKTLNDLAVTVMASTQKLLGRWKQKEGSVINFTKEMAHLTIEVVAKALFTGDVTEKNIQLIWDNLNYLNYVMGRRTLGIFFLPDWLNSYQRPKVKRCIRELNELVDGIIEKRKSSTENHTDLLQLLLDARYEETGESLTDREIRDELMTLFVAGHETTVNALSWCWYLLLRHPEKLNKLKEEARAVYAESMSFTRIKELAYTDCVTKEGMRLYPPVAGIGRLAINDDHFQGYAIQGGENVAINIAGLHRHANYWQNPNDFIPERFEHFENKGLNRFFYLPFGGGPRICIGNNFAMTEMILINSMLALYADVELANTSPITSSMAITLKPGNGVMVKVNKVS